MSKLSKFKEWLTIEDAAKHLSSVLDEEVRVEDVLGLALDGHLVLSVYIGGDRYGLPGELVLNTYESTNVERYKHLRANRSSEIYPLHENIDSKFIQQWPPAVKKERLVLDETSEKNLYVTIDDRLSVILQEEIVHVVGVWDIMLISSGLKVIRDYYRYLIAGTVQSDDYYHDGIFLFKADGTIRQLQYSNYDVIGGHPNKRGIIRFSTNTLNERRPL